MIIVEVVYDYVYKYDYIYLYEYAYIYSYILYTYSYWWRIGKIQPAKVLVVGAGVAGLAAIQLAKKKGMEYI